MQVVRYPQGEAGFKASQGLLREIAEGLGQPINAAAPLSAETIIGSLAVGQTEGTVTIMFTDVEESTRLLSTRGFTTSHEIMKAYETIIDAKGGEILVSDIVRQLVGPVDEMKFEFRGRYKLKGFPDRWRLHQVTPGEVKEASRVLTSGDGFVDREQERLDIRMTLDRAATGN